jgi:hypothetical protein
MRLHSSFGLGAQPKINQFQLLIFIQQDVLLSRKQIINRLEVERSRNMENIFTGFRSL